MSDDRKKPREVKTAADEVTEQPSQRRRRLVKGALSAPVFLTLQSGAIAANSSNDFTVAEEGDKINTPAECVSPDMANFPLDFEPGTNKADFGVSAQCNFFDGTPSIDSEGRLRCADNPELGGYIITASSATSLTGCV